MSIIKEKETKMHIIREYKTDEINTKEDAINWLSNIRNIEGLNTYYIHYSDLTSDIWDSQDVKLDIDVSIETMKQELEERNFIDLISINSDFNKKPIVIGVDLRNNTPYITIRKKAAADLELLEKLLNLV